MLLVVMGATYHIAIVGAGPVGTALAKRLGLLGHSITISNSRGPDTLREQEKATGARALEIQPAIAQADIVILAVPMSSITALKSVFDLSLRPSTVIVDSGNYYPSRDGNISLIDNGLGETAWTSQTLSRSLVKAFNNIIASNIVSSARPRSSSDRVALPVSGDDEKSKALVLEIVDQIGFDAYDAGSLADSWRQQPGTPAYCTEPTTVQLIKLLASADREKAVKNRDQAREIFEKLPPDYSPDILKRVSRLAAGLDRFDFRTWVAATQFLWAVVLIKLGRHG